VAGELAMPCALATVKVDVFHVEGMDVAGDVSEDSQADVDEEVGSASGDHEDADRWD